MGIKDKELSLSSLPQSDTPDPVHFPSMSSSFSSSSTVVDHVAGAHHLEEGEVVVVELPGVVKCLLQYPLCLPSRPSLDFAHATSLCQLTVTSTVYSQITENIIRRPSTCSLSITSLSHSGAWPAVWWAGGGRGSCKFYADESTWPAWLASEVGWRMAGW